MMTKESYDHLITRCPLLGGEEPFFYCRKQGLGHPCPRLAGCWRKRIDLELYLKSFFSAEEIKAFFFQSPPGRMDTFLSNLERVNSMQKEQEKLIAAIQKAAVEGKISCAQATRLADEHQFPRREMSALLDELKIKLKNCQLGCF